jgi:peptide deformylase
MAILRLRTYPDPALRRRCAPVVRFDGELRRLARREEEACVAAAAAR